MSLSLVEISLEIQEERNMWSRSERWRAQSYHDKANPFAEDQKVNNFRRLDSNTCRSRNNALSNATERKDYHDEPTLDTPWICIQDEP